MKPTLSSKEARHLILQTQLLCNTKSSSNALNDTLFAIEHLGYVQIDTICVVQRAHHHTLWARNPSYQPSFLDTLVKEKKVFEYWSHAAAFLPMNEYRYTLLRKQAFLTGVQKHWGERDNNLMKEVLKRIENEGPLMAKDFEHGGHSTKEWTRKPAKRALEYLFMQGDLMISSRNNFHKVYDLTHRVLPNSVDITVPSIEEYSRFLITKYLMANALGQASQMGYLLKNTKQIVVETIKEMLWNKELIKIDVQGVMYYALPSLLEISNFMCNSDTLKILSPFDNLLIQRKRMQDLFGFDYLLECYVPEAKRQYGYFCLPILWENELVARMDCKVNKKEAVLDIYTLALEPSLLKKEAFALALCKELLLFALFNGCKAFVLHNSLPSEFKSIFQSAQKQI
jgi:uncharacterized protein YcaQ